MAKLGRNDQCHCGSGKKYKNCCSGFLNYQASSNDRNNLFKINIHLINLKYGFTPVFKYEQNIKVLIALFNSNIPQFGQDYFYSFPSV